MASVQSESSSGGAPRCAYCGDAIGVYEPATQVIGALAWVTSRAAEPSLSYGSPGLLYHADCYELGRPRELGHPRELGRPHAPQ